MSTKTLSKYTSEKLKTTKSKTDWSRIMREARSGVEPDMSHTDDAEATDEEFAATIAKKRAGRPKIKHPKEHINIRIDADILAALRTMGRGWQTRINSALREYVKGHR